MQNKIDAMECLKESKTNQTLLSEFYTVHELRATFQAIIFDWLSAEISDDREEREKVCRCFQELDQKLCEVESTGNIQTRFKISPQVMEETFITVILEWFSGNFSSDEDVKSRASASMSEVKRFLRNSQLF